MTSTKTFTASARSHAFQPLGARLEVGLGAPGAPKVLMARWSELVLLISVLKWKNLLVNTGNAGIGLQLVPLNGAEMQMDSP